VTVRLAGCKRSSLLSLAVSGEGNKSIYNNDARKRKLKPDYDMSEVSDVLSSVAEEFSRMSGGSKSGYPLSSLFGTDPSPTKMIRLQFDADDGSGREAETCDDRSISSPLRRVVDGDAMIDGRTLTDDESSNGSSRETEKEFPKKFWNETGEENLKDSSEGASLVGGLLAGVSESVRQAKDRRCSRRHCRHRCKKHRREKRRRGKSDSRRSAESEASQVILFLLLLFIIFGSNNRLANRDFVSS